MSSALSKADDTYMKTKPVAIKMTLIKNMYTRKFDSFANFRTTKVIGTAFLTLSMALQILFTILYFRYPIRRLLSFPHHYKVRKRKTKLRSHLTVHGDDLNGTLTLAVITTG